MDLKQFDGSGGGGGSRLDLKCCGSKFDFRDWQRLILFYNDPETSRMLSKHILVCPQLLIKNKMIVQGTLGSDP